jgi:hypothetical protein
VVATLIEVPIDRQASVAGRREFWQRGAAAPV